MTGPLSDEEELLRLVVEGLSASKIAERKQVSRQAVSQRLDALRPVLDERGITVKSGRPTLSPYWVPWHLGRSRWRYHYITKMLRLLGRSVEGPPLSDSDKRRLSMFVTEMDSMDKLPSGRGVAAYRGEANGFEVVDRKPWDRGYLRWPEDQPDTRPLPPELTMPDEPYTDPSEIRLWRLTSLTPEERHARIVKMREGRDTQSGDIQRNAG